MSTTESIIKAVSLIRVSSKPQLDRYGPSSQRLDNQRGMQRLGWSSSEEIVFQESASKVDDRDKFTRLLDTLVNRAKCGEIQRLMLGRWDRLGRDGRNAGGYYLETLRRVGLQVRMGDEDFDVNPDDQDYDERVSGFSFEEVIRRTKASGLMPPMIQRRVDNYMRIEGMGEAEALAMALEGRGSMRWNRETIRRMVLNPAVRGRFYERQNGGEPILVVDDPGLAILTEEQVEQFKAKLKENQRLASRHAKYDYPPI